MKTNKIMKGVAISLLVLVSIAFAAVPGIFTTVTASTSMTAPVFNGALNGNATTATTASNSTDLGGVPSTSYCQSGGSGCPSQLPTVGNVSDVSGSRSVGTTYHNTNGYMIYVSGYLSTSGSAFGQVSCAVGSSSPTMTVFSSQFGATTSGDNAGFACMVPAGWFYSITTSGSASFSPGGWYETGLSY